jgi:hypothetical protein
MSFEPQDVAVQVRRLNRNNWPLGRDTDGEPEYVIQLITPVEFAALPDGTELISIMGDIKVKGIDYIDDDTRGGYLAFGVNR